MWTVQDIQQWIKSYYAYCWTKTLFEFAQWAQVKSKEILADPENGHKWKEIHPCMYKFQTNGKVVSDGQEISNKFNRFFVNVESTLANAIPPTK